MTIGLNDDVTWVWPNMVDLNVMGFSKWYEWDGLWSQENEWDGYGLKETKMKRDQWSC